MSASTGADVIFDSGPVTTAANYTSAVYPVSAYRYLKLEVTGVALSGGTSPNVNPILEDFIAGGTVQAGQIGTTITAAQSSGVLMMGEGLPLTPTTSWLSNISQVNLAFNRLTHCRFEVNLSNSPTSASYRVRLLGFT